MDMSVAEHKPAQPGVENGRQHDERVAAQAMMDWFTGYMYGFTQEVGEFSPVATRRFARYFGRDTPIEDQLAAIQDELFGHTGLPHDELGDADKTSVLLYFCGFDNGTLRALTGNDKRTKELIHRLFPLPRSKEPRPETVAPLGGVAMSQVIGTNETRVRPGETAVFVDVDNLPWASDALCVQVDPDIFFPEKGDSTKEPKRVCAQCPMAEECLLGALQRKEEFGVFGGLTTSERGKLMARARRYPGNGLALSVDSAVKKLRAEYLPKSRPYDETREPV